MDGYTKGMDRCFIRENVMFFHVLIINPGTIHHLTINVLSNSSVNISWELALLSNGVILHYYISIRSLTQNQSVIFETEENLHHIIHNLS